MSLADDYAAMPYLGKAEPLTHPTHLYATAWVRGVNAAPPETARVLEIGCGDGANLVSLAYSLPAARLTGIDRSGAAVTRGQAAVTALGLDKCRLHLADIRRLEVEVGSFDYVIAHGFASWVAPDVLDAALELSRAALTDDGLLYLSYNVRPAWGVRGALRDVMLQAAGGAPDLTRAVKQARAAIELLAETLGSPEPTDHHGSILAREIELVRGAPDFGVVHDYLSPDNHAYSVHQVSDRASQRGFSLLEELRPLGRDPREWTRRRHELATASGDGMLAELMSDALDRRGFRASLFRVSDGALSRPRGVAALALDHANGFTCALVPTHPGASQVFKTAEGAMVRFDDPAFGALVNALVAAWPEARSATDLAASLGASAEVIAPGLASLYRAGHLGIRRGVTRCSREPTERPRATALARFEARERTFVTSVDHMAVQCDERMRALIEAMDGTRDLTELGLADKPELLAKLVHRGVIAGPADVREPATVEPTADARAPEQADADEQSGGDAAVPPDAASEDAESAAGDEPAGDEPAGDEPAGDEPAGDEVAGDEVAGDEVADTDSAGDDSAGGAGDDTA